MAGVQPQILVPVTLDGPALHVPQVGTHNSMNTSRISVNVYHEFNSPFMPLPQTQCQLFFACVLARCQRCVNGRCIAPNLCACSSGWTGASCEIGKLPHCIQSSPHNHLHYLGMCEPRCVNGRCTSPNTCICSSGWRGAACTAGIHNNFYERFFHT
jgi:hypothetical protein